MTQILVAELGTEPLHAVLLQNHLQNFCVLRNTQNMGDFYAGEVSRLAGFQKPWMLIHLERSEIFIREHHEDKRHGKIKKYTFRDLIILRAIKKMLDVGLRPARVKAVLRALAEEEGLPTSREAAELFSREHNSAFFISRDHVLFAKTDKEVLDLSAGRQLSFSFMVSVKSIIDEVACVVRIYEERRSGNWKVDEPVLEELCLQSKI